MPYDSRAPLAGTGIWVVVADSPGSVGKIPPSPNVGCRVLRGTRWRWGRPQRVAAPFGPKKAYNCLSRLGGYSGCTPSPDSGSEVRCNGFYGHSLERPEPRGRPSASPVGHAAPARSSAEPPGSGQRPQPDRQRTAFVRVGSSAREVTARTGKELRSGLLPHATGS